MLKANFKELFEPVFNLIFTVFILIFVRWMDSSRSLMAQVCLYRLSWVCQSSVNFLIVVVYIPLSPVKLENLFGH